MKKVLCAVICVMLTIAISISVLIQPIYAYSYQDSSKSYTTISPTKAQFKSAKSPKYINSRETISDSISSEYSVDIFHYKAPKSGYYKMYTTGSLDTIGAVFEENNFLWSYSYDSCGYNDDSGLNLNFKIVTSLDKNEDYYIGVRGYGKKTGNYNLQIAPNDDLIYSKIGGIWIKTDNVKATDTLAKLYLNKYQVQELYQMLRDTQTKQVFANFYVQSGAIGAWQALLNQGLTIFGYVDNALSFADDVMNLCSSINPVVSGFISITGSTLVNLFDICYANINKISWFLGELQTYGGAGYKMEMGRDVYYATNGVCISINRHHIVINNGVYHIEYNTYDYDFNTYNSTSLYGINYEKGLWY